MDQNDNGPLFSEKEFVFTIYEDEKTGTKVGQVKAEDKDEGENALVNYKIVGQDEKPSTKKDSYPLFNIDYNTGIITSGAIFDREKQDSFNFQVIAEDRQSPNKKDIAKVVVKIGDVNDNKPILSQPGYEFSIEEGLYGARKLGIISATDADAEANGEFSYTLVPTQDEFSDTLSELTNPEYYTQKILFSIGQTSGELQVNRMLDREKQSIYYFQVCVNDKGRPNQLVNCAPVQINVLVNPLKYSQTKFSLFFFYLLYCYQINLMYMYVFHNSLSIKFIYKISPNTSSISYKYR